MTTDFYASIAPVDGFERLADPEVYAPVPDDWWVACADIAGSTQAITEGKYKAVNTVGVAAIAGLRNVAKPMELPYVFGGDGAVVLLPPELADQARSALAGTVSMADRAFSLHLRAALVPVSVVRGSGKDVLVARHRVSADYVQAALFGGGVEWVEEALKEGSLRAEYQVAGRAEADVDYRGLECRWKEIPSPGAETIAVIVEVGPDTDDPLALFKRVMARTREIYGEDADCRPVDESGLSVALTGVEQNHETAVHSWKERSTQRLMASMRQRIWVALGWLIMSLGLRFGDFDGARYRRELVANTDFRKFDGTVRFVLSGSPAQRTELETFLAGEVRRGILRWGIHVSTGALMTCLIDQRQGAHFHFVDAAGGGYAAAARSLKSQRL